MERQLTKVFTEHRWYRRSEDGLSFVEVSADHAVPLSIDEQVRDWVEETGKLIVHPGQLGMHSAWHGTADDPYILKCITLGLAILYQD